ncbi:MAG TPA: hypothetical protein VEF72_11975 [Mycobacterium sp.]|nr:hypothetical protein [Mycobacterium sp.]
MTWYVLPIAAVAVERMAELVVSFADRASVDIVQAGHPVRRFGHHPGQPATGLAR